MNWHQCWGNKVEEWITTWQFIWLLLCFSIRLAREFALEGKHDYTDHLQRVQCILQDVNSCIATPHSSAREIHLQRTEFDSSHVDEIEEWIDLYSNQMPPLESFILPVYSELSSQVLICLYIRIFFFFFQIRVEGSRVQHFMFQEQSVEGQKEQLYHSLRNRIPIRKLWDISIGLYF